MRFLNKLSILPFCATLFFTNVNADVSPTERLFAERVAMREMDKKCNYFHQEERGAVNAFVLQARGDILRKEDDISRVNLLIYQAKQGVAGKNCNDKAVINEAKNLVDSYYAWRSQNIIEYQGLKNKWTASRAGVDNWRVWQVSGSANRFLQGHDSGQIPNGEIKVGYILTSSGLIFGAETTNNNYKGARVYLRDANTIGYPSIKDAGNPAPRVGTNSFMAAYILPAQTRLKVNKPPINGKLFIFPKEAAIDAATLDPRDYFEVEMYDAYGKTQSYVFEVGDLISAFVFGSYVN